MPIGLPSLASYHCPRFLFLRDQPKLHVTVAQQLHFLDLTLFVFVDDVTFTIIRHHRPGDCLDRLPVSIDDVNGHLLVIVGRC